MPGKQDCTLNQNGWTFEKVERAACNYVDLRGKKILNEPVTGCNDFENGRAAVDLYKRTLIINEKGETVKEVLKDVEARWSTDKFSEGLVSARSDLGNGVTRYSVFSRSGDLVFQLDAKGLSKFSEGFAEFRDAQNEKYGFVDRAGKVVIEAKYENVRAFQNGVAAVRVSSKDGWGFISTNGESIFETKYGSISSLDNGFAVFETTDFGVIDKSGKVIIAPQFEDYLFRGDVNRAMPFSEGLSYVNGGGDSFYLDREGNLAFRSIEISFGGEFRDGIARAKVSRNVNCESFTPGNWGFIDPKGEWSIQPDYQRVGYFKEGLAAASTKDKWGFINLAGEWVIEPIFSIVGEFSEGIAPAQYGQKWGYVDSQGEWVISPTFDGAASLSDGLAVVKVGEKHGYVDQNGKFAIDPIFDLAGNFIDGIAPVSVLDKWGYIDRTGAWVIEPDFEAIQYASEGLIGAKKGENWGFLNTNGAWIISPEFQQVDVFKEGLAPAKKDGLFGYIDVTGEWVIMPRYNRAFSFSEKIAVVEKPAGLYQYIGRNGNWGPHR